MKKGQELIVSLLPKSDEQIQDSGIEFIGGMDTSKGYTPRIFIGTPRRDIHYIMFTLSSKQKIGVSFTALKPKYNKSKIKSYGIKTNFKEEDF